MSATLSGAVLLDLDGTLSDNYPGIAASIVYAMARLGEPAPQVAVLPSVVARTVRPPAAGD